MEGRVPETYYRKRLEKVKAVLDGEPLDALLVMNPAQKGYLSGFTSGVFIAPGGVILMTGSDQPDFYLTGGTDFEECKSVLGPLGWEVRAFYGSRGETVHQLVRNVASDLGLKGIGVERKHASLQEFEAYGQYLAVQGIELMGVGELVDRLRMVKDEWEIAQIKCANDVYYQAFSSMLEHVRPGVTEWELCAHFEHVARLHGAGAMRLAGQTVLVSGPRTALPHGSLTHRRLEVGDGVTIDCGTTYNGYCADVTRTFVVGKADDRQREVYQTVLDAQLAAIEAMEVGRPRGECAARGMEVICQRGFADYMVHGAGGHGIGLEVHEAPATHGDEPWVAGNVVTIEPGVYIPNWGGVRIEDDVVLTPQGPSILTSVSKELLEV